MSPTLIQYHSIHSSHILFFQLIDCRCPVLAAVMVLVAVIYLTGIEIYSGYGFSFCVYNASTHGPTECPTHDHGILPSIVSDQGTYICYEVLQWDHTSGINWSHHIPNYPKAAILIV